MTDSKMEAAVANEFLTMSSERLMDRLGMPNSIDGHKVAAELLRRQTEAQIMAARWMRWSVVALTAATVINAVVQIGLQISN